MIINRSFLFIALALISPLCGYQKISLFDLKTFAKNQFSSFDRYTPYKFLAMATSMAVSPAPGTKGYQLKKVDELNDDVIYCIRAEHSMNPMYPTSDLKFVRHSGNRNCPEQFGFRAIRVNANGNQTVVRLQHAKSGKILTAGSVQNKRQVISLVDNNGQTAQNQKFRVFPSGRKNGKYASFHLANLSKGYLLDVESGSKNDNRMITWHDPHKRGNQAFVFEIINLPAKRDAKFRNVGFKVKNPIDFADDLIYCIRAEYTGGPLYTKNGAVRHSTSKKCVEGFMVMRDSKNKNMFRFKSVKTKKFMTLKQMNNKLADIILSNDLGNGNAAKAQKWSFEMSNRSNKNRAILHAKNAKNGKLLDVFSGKPGDHRMITWYDPHKKGNQAFTFEVMEKITPSKPAPVSPPKQLSLWDSKYNVVSPLEFRGGLIYCIRSEHSGLSLYSTKDKKFVRQSGNKNCPEGSGFRVIRDWKYKNRLVVRLQSMKTKLFMTIGSEKGKLTSIILKKNRKRDEGSDIQRWIVNYSGRSNVDYASFHLTNLANGKMLDVHSAAKGDKQMISYPPHYGKNQTFTFQVMRRYKWQNALRKVGFKIKKLHQLRGNLFYCIRAEHSMKPIYATKNGSFARHSGKMACPEESLFRVIRDRKYKKRVVLRFKNKKTGKFLTTQKRKSKGEFIALKKNMGRGKGSDTQRWIAKPSGRKKNGFVSYHLANMASKDLLDVSSGRKNDNPMITWPDPHKKGNQAFVFEVRAEYFGRNLVRERGFRVRDTKDFRWGAVYCVQAQHSMNHLYPAGEKEKMLRQSANGGCVAGTGFRVLRDKSYKKRFVVRLKSSKTKCFATAGQAKGKRQEIYLRKNLRKAKGFKTQLWIVEKRDNKDQKRASFHLKNMASNYMLDVSGAQKKDERVITWKGAHKRGNQSFIFEVKGRAGGRWRRRSRRWRWRRIRRKGWRIRKLKQIRRNLVYCIRAEHSMKPLYVKGKNMTMRHSNDKKCGKNSRFRFIRDWKFKNKFVYRLRSVNAKRWATVGNFKNKRQYIMVKKSMKRNKGFEAQRWEIKPSSRKVKGVPTFHIMNLQKNLPLDVETGKKNDNAMITYQNFHKKGNQAFIIEVRGRRRWKSMCRKRRWMVRWAREFRRGLVYCIRARHSRHSLMASENRKWLMQGGDRRCRRMSGFRVLHDKKYKKRFVIRLRNTWSKRFLTAGAESDGKQMVELKKNMKRTKGSDVQRWVLVRSKWSNRRRASFRLKNVATGRWMDVDGGAKKQVKMIVSKDSQKGGRQEFIFRVRRAVKRRQRMWERGWRVKSLKQFRRGLVYCIRAEHSGKPMYGTNDGKFVKHWKKKGCVRGSGFRMIRDKSYKKKWVFRIQNMRFGKYVTALEMKDKKRQVVALRKSMGRKKRFKSQRWELSRAQRKKGKKPVFHLKNLDLGFLLDVESGKKGHLRMITWHKAHKKGNQAFYFRVLRRVNWRRRIRTRGWIVRKYWQILKGRVYCLRNSMSNNAIRVNNKKSALVHTQSKKCVKGSGFRIFRVKNNQKKWIVRVWSMFARKWVVPVGNKANRQAIGFAKGAQAKGRRRWVVSMSKRSKKRRAVFNLKSVFNGYRLTADKRNMLTWRQV